MRDHNATDGAEKALHAWYACLQTRVATVLALHARSFRGINLGLGADFDPQQRLACQGIRHAAFSLEIAKAFMPLHARLQAPEIRFAHHAFVI